MQSQAIDLKSYIRDIPDFPKKGIVFKDITPLLANAEAFEKAVEAIAQPFRNEGISQVICIEARGFIFGAAVSKYLGAGFVPVRKKGKLPYKTYETTYDLEYGSDTLTIHQDAIKPGEKILIVDDLLATGGTIRATADLLSKLKANVVAVAFLIELTFLNGRKLLGNTSIHSVISY